MKVENTKAQMRKGVLEYCILSILAQGEAYPPDIIGTLKEALSQEALLASIVILVFLLHLRTTVTVLATLPLAVALTFILMYLSGVDSNIMSLAGLAIAIGDVADTFIPLRKSPGTAVRVASLRHDDPVATVPLKPAVRSPLNAAMQNVSLPST